MAIRGDYSEFCRRLHLLFTNTEKKHVVASLCTKNPTYLFILLLPLVEACLQPSTHAFLTRITFTCRYQRDFTTTTFHAQLLVKFIPRDSLRAIFGVSPAYLTYLIYRQSIFSSSQSTYKVVSVTSQAAGVDFIVQL